MGDTSRMALRSHLYHLCGYICLLVTVRAIEVPCDGFTVSRVSTEVYQQAGDLIIGGLLPVRKYSSVKACSDILHDPTKMEMVEGIVFAVKQINKRKDILSGITLGWTILDTCSKESTALSQALSFLPRSSLRLDGNFTYQAYNDSQYNVVGVVGAYYSPSSLLAAPVLGLAHIPLISPGSTSDLLSDKTKYEYFLRVVQPDIYQAQAIVDLLAYFNWTYISVIHSEGSYGFEGAKRVRKMAAKQAICVAYDKEIPHFARSEEFDNTMKELIDNNRAKAVVMFVYEDAADGLLAAANRANAFEFIWIFTDAVSGAKSLLVPYDDVATGSILIDFYKVRVPEFRKYFGSLSPTNNKINPWLQPLWEQQFPTKPSQRQLSSSGMASVLIDATYTLAYALDAVIKNACPNIRVTSDRRAIKACIKGDVYLEHLKNVTFKGVRGVIKFDKSLDMEDKYNFAQYQGNGKTRTFALWNRVNKVLTVNVDKLVWNNRTKLGNRTYPASICSLPCKEGEVYVQLESKCCWKCRQCRADEVVDDNSTSCSQCPPFQWPDEKSFHSCRPIQPLYIQAHHGLGILCLVLFVLGILLVSALSGLFFKYRQERLIKSTSRELSVMMLVGIFLAYASAATFILMPSTASCCLRRLGFNVSFTIIFGPLMTKTNRVYRIFAQGKKGVKKMAVFVGSRSQVFIASLFIIIQLAVSVTTFLIHPPRAMRVMPVRMEKYVELVCYLPMDALLPPLSYNLCLIAVSGYYAFKTRKLPDNFNESKFIFLSACATIFVWIALITTYFSTFYRYHRDVLLSVALIMNATVVLLCHFVPKLYAVVCVNEDDQKILGSVVSGKWTGRVQPWTSANTPSQDVIS